MLGVVGAGRGEQLVAAEQDGRGEGRLAPARVLVVVREGRDQQLQGFAVVARGERGVEGWERRGRGGGGEAEVLGGEGADGAEDERGGEGEAEDGAGVAVGVVEDVHPGADAVLVGAEEGGGFGGDGVGRWGGDGGGWPGCGKGRGVSGVLGVLDHFPC